MVKKFNDKQISDQIDANSNTAKTLIKDEDKMESFLESLENKLKKVPLVGNQLSNVPTLVSLVRSYVHKDYLDIPIGSIIAIVSALIYFLSPADLILDNLPLIGHMDDVTVLGLVWKMVEEDIAKYIQWQLDNGKRVKK